MLLEIELNLDFNYTFLIDMTQIGIPSGAEKIGKV